MKDISYSCAISTETIWSYCKQLNGGGLARIWCYCHRNRIQVGLPWKRCRGVSRNLPRNTHVDLQSPTVRCIGGFPSATQMIGSSDWVMPWDQQGLWGKADPGCRKKVLATWIAYPHEEPVQSHPSMEKEPILSPSCELLPEFPECLLHALWSQLYVKTLGKPYGWHSRTMVTPCYSQKPARVSCTTSATGRTRHFTGHLTQMTSWKDHPCLLALCQTSRWQY